MDIIGALCQWNKWADAGCPAGRLRTAGLFLRQTESWTDALHPLRYCVMTAIRVIFDGKAFIPQQPVSLPDQSEALVLLDQNDPLAQSQLDAAVQAYYQAPVDAGDEAWAKATAPQSQRAWDED
jgi:hypothetical protein